MKNESVFGPVVLDDSTNVSNCACGDKRPHVHNVRQVSGIQEWYRRKERTMIEKDPLVVGATVWVRVPSMLEGGYEDHPGVVSEILYDGSVNVVKESGEDINPQKPVANAQREISDDCAPRDPVWGFFRAGSPQWLFGIHTA